MRIQHIAVEFVISLETQVEIVDSVRGKDVFILQTGHGDSL